MISSVEIENFRCFHSTQINNFSRVNLFGGKNNSGKTALLEAIFLGISPRINTVNRLRRLRQIDLSFLKEMPERAWDDLFLDASLGSNIKIKSNKIDTYNLSLFIDQSLKDFEQIGEDELSEDDDDDIKGILSNRESIGSTLHLTYQVNDTKDIVSTGLAHKKGILTKEMNVPDLKTINLIPSNFKVSNTILVQEFDKALLNNFSDLIVEGLQIIDKEIVGIQSLNIGSPSLYLKKSNGALLSIGLFGDAISKVINYLLRIVNNKDGILLIDEIENGIHYSNQTYLWEKLFLLAQKFDVQIFATTHSIDMIKAFEKVISNEVFSDEGVYFELFRHRKTNEIAANRKTRDGLEYEIENNIPLRGE